MAIDFEKIKKLAKRKASKTKKSKDFLDGKKILHSPKVKLRGLDSEKAIMKGTGNLKLVRDVPNREYTPDNRSLFFRDSFNKEREDNRKWIIK